MKMTVTRALKELKTLDNRIENKIENAVFVASAKTSSDKVNNTCTRVEFDKMVKSQFDSINDLILRKKYLKSAVINSNAMTKATVAGIEYTVAEVIERKNAIDLDKMLLREMESQYNRVKAMVQNQNDKMEMNLHQILNTTVAGDAKKNNEALIEYSELYRKQNGYEIVDVLGIEKIIEKMKDDINNFEIEVDSVLSEINSITMIEIPD